MCDQEAGQIHRVQASLLIHWEVSSTFIKLMGSSARAAALTLAPTTALTHLLEEDYCVLGEAKLLKELWLVSKAKGYI